MLDVQAHDHTEVSTVLLDVGQTKRSSSNAPVHERIVEARRLVERACHALGAESREEPFELRLTRALALNLLDELSVLDERTGK